MKPQPYLALLRGINVGGKNLIKMTALKTCFEDMGFENVTTFIQSGNVLFDASQKDVGKLTNAIEKELSKHFNYQSRVVIVSHDQLKETVKHAPKGFGTDAKKYRYDIIFLKKPLTAKEAIKQVKIREGVDEATVGKDVLYFSRLISKASQSYLSRIIQLPIYQNMTIRNWNTTTKLLTLTEQRTTQ